MALEGRVRVVDREPDNSFWRWALARSHSLLGLYAGDGQQMFSHLDLAK